MIGRAPQTEGLTDIEIKEPRHPVFQEQDVVMPLTTVEDFNLEIWFENLHGRGN